jgi:hypothetical protein
MAYEHGTAIIKDNLAMIETDLAPHPVAFQRAQFGMIKNGDKVSFIRSPSDGSWAINVMLTSTHDELMQLAEPKPGFTPEAADFVALQAAHFLAQAQAAPTSKQALKHVAFAKDAMRNIALKGNEQPGPLDERDVRAMFR